MLQCQAGVSPFQSVRLSHTARPHFSLGYKTSAAYAGTLTPPKVRAYFENALLNNRPRGAKLTDYTAVVLSDTAVAVSGLDALTGVRDGKTFGTTGRVTFVIAKRGADWQIVQFHRSLVPN